jgi:hypothetical protein
MTSTSFASSPRCQMMYQSSSPTGVAQTPPMFFCDEAGGAEPTVERVGSEPSQGAVDGTQHRSHRRVAL